MTTAKQIQDTWATEGARKARALAEQLSAGKAAPLPVPNLGTDWEPDGTWRVYRCMWSFRDGSRAVEFDGVDGPVIAELSPDVPPAHVLIGMYRKHCAAG